MRRSMIRAWSESSPGTMLHAGGSATALPSVLAATSRLGHGAGATADERGSDADPEEDGHGGDQRTCQ
jgi:hypothetical protein